MSDDEEQIIDNKLDVSELSHNEEEIEYDSASEMSFVSDFDEEDDEFQAPLVVPQQPLILSQPQPRLFYGSRDQPSWNIHPPVLPAIIENDVCQGVCTSKGKPQKQRLNRGNCSLIIPC